jgi:hypothetical protein
MCVHINHPLFIIFRLFVFRHKCGPLRLEAYPSVLQYTQCASHQSLQYFVSVPALKQEGNDFAEIPEPLLEAASLEVLDISCAHDTTPYS